MLFLAHSDRSFFSTLSSFNFYGRREIYERPLSYNIMFLHSLWARSATKIQKGVGDHLENKNELNIKICFFKFKSMKC